MKMFIEMRDIKNIFIVVVFLVMGVFFKFFFDLGCIIVLFGGKINEILVIFVII